MDFLKADFSKEDILKVLELFPLKLENPKIANLTGIANSNYRVTDSSFDIALKIYSHGQSDKNKIEKELEIIKLFSQKGIKVPELIVGNDNQTLQSFNGFNIVATKFIDGQIFDSLKFTPERMFEVGKLVASVEDVAKQIEVSAFSCMNFEEEFDYVSKNLEKEIASKGYDFDLEEYKSNLEPINQIINKLDNSQDKYFLHKDIWPWNLIENINGVYLLDFNDWAIGNQIIELAVPILEFSMFKSDQFNFEIAKNILDGYKFVKPLAYSATDLWETILFICFLYFAYNVIQADEKFESEIYLKRIHTLLNNRNLLNTLYSQ